MEEYIRKLKTMHAKTEQAVRDEREMSRPLLPVSSAAWVREQVKDRDAFLLIAIRLFSPRCFTGQRMSSNIRAELGRLMGLGKTYVSKQIKLVLFRYENMPSFRAGVDASYERLIEKLDRRNR